MYAQLDDGMTWSKETNTVLQIDGAPLEDEKIYRCAVLYLVAMKGIDGVTPLADWCKENEANPEVHTDEETAHGAKEILVEHFSRAAGGTSTRPSFIRFTCKRRLEGLNRGAYTCFVRSRVLHKATRV